METATVAAVQATPCFLDREGTVERVGELAREAAARGARLTLFPEAFVPGYPDWVWRTRPWGDGSGRLYARLLDQAVEVPGPATAALGRIAREVGAYLAVGIDERVGSTLYNSLLYVGPGGDVLGVHRKLVPTGGERLVWGSGDGAGLVVVDTPFGRVGGLICWENYMPLARAALYAQGVDVYLAPTWDNSATWVPTLRHVAKEGRVHVVGTNSFLRGSDIPAREYGVEHLYGGDDDWLSRGNAAIVDPEGDLLAGPLVGEAGILTAEVDTLRARASRQQFDPVGHYARPDVFRLVVDGRAHEPVEVVTGSVPEPDPWRGAGSADEVATRDEGVPVRPPG